MNKRVKSKISLSNFSRKNRRGQFYLVAGIIIISVIVSLITISNYLQKSSTVIVNDLKEELKIETQKILNYDIGHAGDSINLYGIDYSSHLGTGIELYFIMGEDPNIEANKYVNGVYTSATENLIIDGDNNKIIFTLEDVNYEFGLAAGENFYYLITQEIKGELFVATG